MTPHEEDDKHSDSRGERVSADERPQSQYDSGDSDNTRSDCDKKHPLDSPSPLSIPVRDPDSVVQNTRPQQGSGGVVRFRPIVANEEDIHTIETPDEEEYKCRWYTQGEYFFIKKDAMNTVRRLTYTSGLEDNDHLSRRGLEIVESKAVKQRETAIKKAVNTVIETQKQIEESSSDPDVTSTTKMVTNKNGEDNDDNDDHSDGDNRSLETTDCSSVDDTLSQRSSLSSPSQPSTSQSSPQSFVNTVEDNDIDDGGCTASERIAQQYSDCVQEAKVRARQRAIQDENEVQEYLQDIRKQLFVTTANNNNVTIQRSSDPTTTTTKSDVKKPTGRNHRKVRSFGGAMTKDAAPTNNKPQMMITRLFRLKAK